MHQDPKPTLNAVKNRKCIPEVMRLTSVMHFRFKVEVYRAGERRLAGYLRSSSLRTGRAQL